VSVRLLQLDKKKCLITKLTTGSSNLSPGTCIHVISCAPGSPTKEKRNFRQDFDLRIMHRPRESQQCWFTFVEQARLFKAWIPLSNEQITIPWIARFVSSTFIPWIAIYLLNGAIQAFTQLREIILKLINK